MSQPLSVLSLLDPLIVLPVTSGHQLSICVQLQTPPLQGVGILVLKLQQGTVRTGAFSMQV